MCAQNGRHVRRTQETARGHGLHRHPIFLPRFTRPRAPLNQRRSDLQYPLILSSATSSSSPLPCTLRPFPLQSLLLGPKVTAQQTRPEGWVVELGRLCLQGRVLLRQPGPSAAFGTHHSHLQSLAYSSLALGNRCPLLSGVTLAFLFNTEPLGWSRLLGGVVHCSLYVLNGCPNTS